MQGILLMDASEKMDSLNLLRWVSDVPARLWEQLQQPMQWQTP